MSRGKANSGHNGGIGSSKTITQHPADNNPSTRAMDPARDEANKARFVAPEGVEASDLPDGGRPTGHNDTPVDIGRRNLPQQHGGAQVGDDDFTGHVSEGGVRGSRDFSDEKNMPGGSSGKN